MDSPWPGLCVRDCLDGVDGGGVDWRRRSDLSADWCVQELRKTLGGTDAGNVGDTAYPMTPIGVIRSCFSTR